MYRPAAIRSVVENYSIQFSRHPRRSRFRGLRINVLDDIPEKSTQLNLESKSPHAQTRKDGQRGATVLGGADSKPRNGGYIRSV